MRHVGAWVTKRSLLTPDATVDGLLRARVSRASIMLNDHAADRAETTFRCHDDALVVAFADACRSAGISVALTSWTMPHPSFLDQAAEAILPLIEATRADLLIWDAEEPWVRAAGDVDHESAASQIASIFAGVRMGLTAIGSANVDALRDLAAVCPIWIPQAYATDGGHANPETIVGYCASQWRRKFGDAGNLEMGLAAYRMPDDPASTMRPPLDECRALEVDSVWYWSAHAILSSPAVASFVSTVRESEPASGIMPTLEIGAMPAGSRVQAVAHVQGLLLGWGFDPGPHDGKPGPKTRAAVEAFQRARGLHATGVIDGGTWWALLAC